MTKTYYKVNMTTKILAAYRKVALVYMMIGYFISALPTLERYGN